MLKNKKVIIIREANMWLRYRKIYIKFLLRYSNQLLYSCSSIRTSSYVRKEFRLRVLNIRLEKTIYIRLGELKEVYSRKLF